VKKSLTNRQAQVLQFVEDYQEANSGAPTLREICDHFCFNSISSARQHLRLIEQKGFLVRKPNCSRSIQLIHQGATSDPTQVVSVPLVGKIAAGSPSFALESAEEILTLPKSLFPGRKLFALRVEGDSMIDAGIFDKDVAVLKSQADFNDGDIAAVIVDEEATLKRLFRSAKGLLLHPENKNYKDQIITENQAERSCRVAGVLVGTIRRF